MHRRNNTANFDMKQVFVDVLVIFAGYFIAGFIYETVRGTSIIVSHLWILSVYTFIFVLCMLQYRMYNITTFFYYDRIILRVLISTVLSALFLTMIIFLAKVEWASRLFFLIFSSVSLVLVVTERLAIRWSQHNERISGYVHVLYIGTEEALERYRRFLDKTAMRIHFDAIVGLDDPRLKDVSSLTDLIVHLHVDEVLMLYEPRHHGFDYEMCSRTCEDMGVTSRLILDMYELPNSKKFVSSVGTYPVLTYHSVSFDRVQLFFKRVVDVVGALFGLVLLSPVMIGAAIAIRLDSPGPILFRQKRAGLNGRLFEMYKFRSMYIDAEERKKELLKDNQVKDGMMFKVANDPRITRVGRFLRKTSIDELPQMINVLKNEMSLVGTRPPTLDEVEKYKRNHWRRISIQPGITGMWQVSGRSDILNFDEVVNLDIEYINNWSLALDFKLIFKTFSAVLTRRGAL